MAYNKLIDLNLLSNFLSKIKSLIPTKTSDLENDSEYITGITSSDVTTALGYTPSSTDTTYSAGNGIDITNTIIKNTQGIEYIVGTQTAATAVWTGNSTDEALYIGKIIAYYLPYAGTSTAATLTLTMKNGATTEAIRLLRVGSNTITTQFAANNVIILIYDGTYWRVSAYYDSDTNTVPTGYCATGASTVAKSATCTYGYRDDTNYFPCLFRYANTAANATLTIATYGTTALPIYVNGERTSATNTFGRGVILFLYYDKAYYCYNDGRLPILVDGVVTSVQDYTNELKNTISEISQVITSTDIDSTPIATFDASAANMPLKGLTIDIEPVQNLNGYDKPWPGGGGKNLWNPEWVINGYISSASYDIISDSVAKTVYIPVEEGETYTVSKTGGTRFRYAFASEEPKVATRCFDFSQNDAATSITVTAPTGATYLAIYVVGMSDSGAESILASVQIELGSTITAYEPYSNICPISGWTGCNINANGKNFMQVTLATMKRLNTSGVWADNKYTYNGITFTVDTDDNGCVTAIAANGTASGDANLNLNGIASQLAPLPTNAGCIISGCPDGGSGDTYRVIAYLFHNSTYLNRMAQDIGNGTLFGSADANNYYARINIKSGVTASNLVFTPMIQLATDSSQAFEPYQGNTYDITFPTEAGTVYGGTLDVTTGGLEVKYIKYTLTPDLQYANNSERTNAFSVYVLLPSGAKGQLNMYCNCLKVQENARDAVVPATQISSSLWSVIIAFPKTIVSSFNDVRTKITELYNSGTPIEIVYQIDQPIVYQLTLQKVTTLLGTNNIWADAGDVTVTYGAYLETIKSYTNQLNNNIPNTSSISNTGLISIKHDSTELFTIQLPLYNGGVSNGT